jgi:hypothetical protein
MSTQFVKADSPACACKQYLLSWREILEAVRLPNNEVSRRRVRRLHTRFPGPISFPKKGGQPAVCMERLLEWWDGLEDLFHQSEQRQADEKATLAQSYRYGKEATVFPEIAGHVRQRRQT